MSWDCGHLLLLSLFLLLHFSQSDCLVSLYTCEAFSDTTKKEGLNVTRE